MSNSKNFGQKGGLVNQEYNSQKNLNKLKNIINSGESKLDFCNLRIPEKN